MNVKLVDKYTFLGDILPPINGVGFPAHLVKCINTNRVLKALCCVGGAVTQQRLFIP